MKALQIEEFGPSGVLRIATRPVPVPGPGQVLVRVAYASVNPADWKIRSGLLPRVAEGAFPFVPGMDFSGVIAAVGPDVDQFRAGDRVAGLTRVGLDRGAQGSYAEYCCTSAVRVVHLPDAVSLAAAATVPTAGAAGVGTVVEIAGTKPGDYVFLNGGSGSLGTLTTQFLKQLGAKVATSCSTAHVGRLQALGIDRVIDYTQEDVLAALADWAPGGVDAIIDPVGQGSLPAHAPDVIREGGMLICIGSQIDIERTYDMAAAARRNVRVLDNIRASPTVGTHLFQVEGLRRVMDGVGRGLIRVPPYTIVPLEQAARAHDAVQAGHFRHKYLLDVGGSAMQG